ncbi:MAG: AAA family ATPase [Armatimonadetes bacterium]|nr:AAA family ATPase [Armatimonadota bacterium]
MILKRLAVRNYGCLGDGEWHFSPGVNVVCGPNEAGKSTLAEAIAQVLLSPAPVSTDKKELLARKTWGRQEMYRLEAEFSHEGTEWRVVRDYADGKSLLTNLSTGEQVRDDAKVRAALAEMARLTAGDPEQQYLATGYLRQGEWASVAKATGVTDLLAQAMEAGGRLVNREAIRELRKERDEYNRGVDRVAQKNPGPVASARSQLEELRKELPSAQEQAAREEQARTEYAEAEDKLKAIEAELATSRPRLEAAKQRRELESQLENVNERLGQLVERIAQADELQGNKERWERELESRRPLTVEEVRQVEEKAREVERLRKEASELMEGAASTLTAVQEREAEAEKIAQEPVAQAAPGVSPRTLLFASLLTLFGIAFLGVALGLGAKLALPSRILLASLGAAMAAFGPIRIFRASAAARAQHAQLVLDRERRTREVMEQAQRMRGEVDALRRRAEKADADATHIETAVQAQLQAWQMPDLVSAREYAEYNEHLRIQINDAQRKIEGALAGRQLSDLRQEQVNLRGRVDLLQGQLSEPAMQAAAMTDAEYGELAQRVAALEEEHRHWTSKRAEGEGWLGATRGSGEKLLVLQEQIKAAEAELAAAERRRQILNKTVAWIEMAMDAARQEAHETLVPIASRFLEKLTAGHYETLSLDASLAPSIDAPEKGAPAAPEELSYATREQVYLALRLAMCEALWPDEGPPLILDEPLLAFDQTRKAAALELLRDLGQRRQLVILTCSHDYDSIAANRVTLASAGT